MKILILEDNHHVQKVWRSEFKEMGLKVFNAFSIQQAEDLLMAHPDLDVVTVDGCVPGVEINTVPFVKTAREKGYKGLMIAVSNNPQYRAKLRRVGCDEECEKEFLVSRIRNFVAVRQPALK